MRFDDHNTEPESGSDRVTAATSWCEVETGPGRYRFPFCILWTCPSSLLRNHGAVPLDHIQRIQPHLARHQLVNAG